MLAFVKQQFFTFLAIMLFLAALFIFLWFANNFWNMFNGSTDFWPKIFIFWLFVTAPGFMGLVVIAMIQVWWLQRKVGQRPKLLILFVSFYMPFVYDQNITDLLTDWFVLWITIIYDDVVSCGQYLFSLLLDLLSGYGYKPVRTLFWYLIVVFGFAFFYNKFGNITSFSDALVFSLTSFHGRGFFPNLGDQAHPIYLHDTLVRLAAAEAVIGLFIEISFIATFTQRYFGK